MLNVKLTLKTEKKPCINLWGLFFLHIFVSNKKDMKQYNENKQTKMLFILAAALWTISLTSLLILKTI
jgi:Mn2+/Fe2+ NRAMP family transporter